MGAEGTVVEGERERSGLGPRRSPPPRLRCLSLAPKHELFAIAVDDARAYVVRHRRKPRGWRHYHVTFDPPSVESFATEAPAG